MWLKQSTKCELEGAAASMRLLLTGGEGLPRREVQQPAGCWTLVEGSSQEMPFSQTSWERPSLLPHLFAGIIWHPWAILPFPMVLKDFDQMLLS